MNHALRNIRNIAQSKETSRLGAIYVGNTDMFNKCKSLVSIDCEADLNLIVFLPCRPGYNRHRH